MFRLDFYGQNLRRICAREKRMCLCVQCAPRYTPSASNKCKTNDTPSACRRYLLPLLEWSSKYLYTFFHLYTQPLVVVEGLWFPFVVGWVGGWCHMKGAGALAGRREIKTFCFYTSRLAKSKLCCDARAHARGHKNT